MSKNHPLRDLYAAQGHRTYSESGVLWIDVGRFSLTSLPYATTVEADLEDLDKLLRKSQRLAAIFPTRLATGLESKTFWVRDRNYGAQSMQRQFRQNVQRGAKECAARPLDWDTLRRKGLSCNIDTMERRGRHSSPTICQDGWDRFCESAAKIPGLEAWGSFHGEDLLAYLIAWKVKDTCEALIAHRSEKAAPLRATHLLFHEFTKTMCQNPELSAVSMGRDWLPTKLSLSRFKTHAGYQAEPVRLAVVLHPAVRGILAHPVTRAALRFLRRLTGNRSAPFDNLEILEAAAATRIPSRRAEKKSVLHHAPR